MICNSAMHNALLTLSFSPKFGCNNFLQVQCVMGFELPFLSPLFSAKKPMARNRRASIDSIFRLCFLLWASFLFRAGITWGHLPSSQRLQGRCVFFGGASLIPICWKLLKHKLFVTGHFITTSHHLITLVTWAGLRRLAEPERSSYESSPSWTKSVVNGHLDIYETCMKPIFYEKTFPVFDGA